jgi:hypothetical protein
VPDTVRIPADSRQYPMGNCTHVSANSAPFVKADVAPTMYVIV